MRADVRSELMMLRELAWYFLSCRGVHPEGSGECCYFCQKAFLPPSTMTFGHKRHPKVDVDITIHHLDENRENNSASNLVLCHDSCHRSYHAKKRAVKRQVYREEVERRYAEKNDQQEKETGAEEGVLTPRGVENE